MDGGSRDPNAGRDESPCGAGGVHGWQLPVEAGSAGGPGRDRAARGRRARASAASRSGSPPGAPPPPSRSRREPRSNPARPRAPAGGGSAAPGGRRSSRGGASPAPAPHRGAAGPAAGRGRDRGSGSRPGSPPQGRPGPAGSPARPPGGRSRQGTARAGRRAATARPRGLAPQPRLEQQERLKHGGEGLGVEAGRVDVEVQTQRAEPGRPRPVALRGAGRRRPDRRPASRSTGSGAVISSRGTSCPGPSPAKRPRAAQDGGGASPVRPPRVGVADVELDREVAKAGAADEEGVRVLLRRRPAEPGAQGLRRGARAEAGELDLDADPARPPRTSRGEGGRSRAAAAGWRGRGGIGHGPGCRGPGRAAVHTTEGVACPALPGQVPRKDLRYCWRIRRTGRKKNLCGKARCAFSVGFVVATGLLHLLRGISHRSAGGALAGGADGRTRRAAVPSRSPGIVSLGPEIEAAAAPAVAALLLPGTHRARRDPRAATRVSRFAALAA